MYDLIIIGGGPAGISAGVYAARKRLKTLFITKEWGGQSIVSVDIQNWIGTPSIAGDKLANEMKNHLETYANETVTIMSDKAVTDLKKEANGTLTVTLDDNSNHTSQAVLIASGSSRRKLDIKGADIFENRGVTYCASCDGPMFAGQDVAVIGGGNAGFETASQLLAYAKSVTLINRSASFKADPITIEKVLLHPNMTTILNATPTEIIGDKFVSCLRYSTTTGSLKEISLTGIFVEIGMIPNTVYAKNVVDLDTYNRIIIDPWTQKTNTTGIWAAGDCTNIHYHQNNISAGDGVRALEDIYVTLKTRI